MCSPPGSPPLPFFPLLRALIAVLGDQELGGVVDQLLRFVGADVRQFVAGNVEQALAEPSVGFADVGMNAVYDDLLTVAEEFQLLRRVAVRRDQRHRDLGERFLRAKRYGALRWRANSGQDIAAVLEALAHQRLDSGRRIGVENVNVQARREATENPGVDRVRPRGAPQINFSGVGFEFLLPAFRRRCFAVERQRRVAVAQQLLPDCGHIGGGGAHHARPRWRL